MTLTQEDLRSATDDLKEYISERVGRVETRLDTLNGSVARHERELARHDAQIKYGPHKDDDKPAFTKRDLRIVVGMLTGMGVVVEVGHKLLSLGLAYLKGSGL